MNTLDDSFNNLQYIKKNGYNYFLHPLTDGTSPIPSRYFGEFRRWALQRLTPKFDYILTAEAMGIPLATTISTATGIPLVIARKRKYNLPGEISILKKTGYSEEFLFINGVPSGSRVVFIDDVYDTGGTLIALSTELSTHNIKIVQALFLVSKKTSPTLDFPIHSFKVLEVPK